MSTSLVSSPELSMEGRLSSPTSKAAGSAEDTVCNCVVYTPSTCTVLAERSVESTAKHCCGSIVVRLDSVVLHGVANVAEPTTGLEARWSWKFCSSGIRGRTCSQE
jgi:hypothetical protein